MKIEIDRITSWQRVLNAARFTIGKEALDKEPSNKFKRSIIFSEHSPIRLLEFDVRMYDFHLPVISNQKYNDYLKVLAAACGVKKKLTSHVARHTFATTVTMANRVPIEVISKMLGHTNIQTTQLYAKVCQQEVDHEFDRLNKIF